MKRNGKPFKLEKSHDRLESYRAERYGELVIQHQLLSILEAEPTDRIVWPPSSASRRTSVAHDGASGS